MEADDEVEVVESDPKEAAELRLRCDPVFRVSNLRDKGEGWHGRRMCDGCVGNGDFPYIEWEETCDTSDDAYSCSSYGCAFSSFS